MNSNRHVEITLDTQGSRLLAILQKWGVEMQNDEHPFSDCLKSIPPLPEGYYVEIVRTAPRALHLGVRFGGTRIFEVLLTQRKASGDGAPWRVQVAAREVKNWDPIRLTYDATQRQIEFDDITTLMQVMLTRHRLGVNV